MQKFTKTGVIAHINNHQPNYGDITPTDFHESMNIIAKANSMFSELPALARRKFNNSPELFLEYVQNPKNHDELHKMGLAERPPSLPIVPIAEGDDKPPAPPPEKPPKE